ncbi:MAG: hypothetical protein FJX77_02690 [Armatimonadetes bacterium]|nr:hypothetical protein [Armatimonadota bacterium]
MRWQKELILGVVLWAAGTALAAPVNVRTEGTKSQTVVMCPDCHKKSACAQVGDYVVGMSVDLDNAKLGTGRLVAHVQGKDKTPVADAKVSVAISMPDHKHGGKPLELKQDRKGHYIGTSNRLGMAGRYRAVVSVTPAGGDTVKQAFTFTR